MAHKHQKNTNTLVWKVKDEQSPSPILSPPQTTTIKTNIEKHNQIKKRNIDELNTTNKPEEERNNNNNNDNNKNSKNNTNKEDTNNNKQPKLRNCVVWRGNFKNFSSTENSVSDEWIVKETLKDFVPLEITAELNKAKSKKPKSNAQCNICKQIGHQSSLCPSSLSFLCPVKKFFIQFNSAEEAFKCSSFLKHFSIVVSDGQKIFVSAHLDVQTLDPLYTITKEDINKLPLCKGAQVKVIVVSHPSEVDSAVNILFNETIAKERETEEKDKILGMDLEYKPTFKKGEYNKTALIQFSSEKISVLFRTNKLFPIPDSLRGLLESNSVVKVGIGLKKDCTRIFKDFGIKVNNVKDIEDLPIYTRCKPRSLRDLTAIFFRKSLPKKAQMSNWEKGTLDQYQIDYGANDAFFSREVYLKLLSIPYSLNSHIANL